jgi:putative flippase GtrA
MAAPKLTRPTAAAPGALAREMLRFALIGVLATGIHYSILFGLVHGADVEPIVATTVGYGVSLVISYVLNRRFTFHVASPVAASFAKFAVIYGVGLVLNGWIVHVLAEEDTVLPAQLAASTVVLFWNYLGARFVVFASAAAPLPRMTLSQAPQPPTTLDP